VVATGITPLINTGIAGKTPGTGQIGAGVVRAPMGCFEAALEALALPAAHSPDPGARKSTIPDQIR